MTPETEKALAWMGYSDFERILTEYGFAIHPSETEDDLREAVKVNILDGTIPEYIITEE